MICIAYTKMALFKRTLTAIRLMARLCKCKGGLCIRILVAYANVHVLVPKSNMLVTFITEIDLHLFIECLDMKTASTTNTIHDHTNYLALTTIAL